VGTVKGAHWLVSLSIYIALLSGLRAALLKAPVNKAIAERAFSNSMRRTHRPCILKLIRNDTTQTQWYTKGEVQFKME
jgi:hypothetical protein